MAWPSTVVAGVDAILASQFNSVVSALQTWGGAVNGGGFALTNVASIAVTGAVSASNLVTFVASGASHKTGFVPDPGSVAGTTKYLREDATWTIPPYPSVFVASGASHATGLVPDPGSSAGSTKFLREDATFALPAYPVTSVFGRTGAVVSASGDYTFSQLSGSAVLAQLPTSVVAAVTNDTNVTGSITSQTLTLGWTGTLAKARTLSTTVYTDQTNTYTAGSKQVTTSSASTAGLNLAGVTADPSSPAAGDHWYRSDLTQLSYYNGTTSKRLATVDQIPAVPVSSVFGRTGAVVAVSGDYSFSLLSGSAVLGQLPSSVVASIVNDTNVTGSISAQALTLGWTGTLAAGRLNSNVVQAITNDTNITGTIASQTLTLGFTGTLAAGRLNSNVVQAITNDTNITGSITAQNLTLGWTGTLAIARGGTGANTAAGALTNLGASTLITSVLNYALTVNNTSSAGWYKLGTVVFSGTGAALQITLQSGASYNTNANNQTVVDIIIRNANDSTAPNLSGATAYIRGNANVVQGLKVASTGASTSISNKSWDVYVNLGAFTPGSYSVALTPNITSWTNSQATATDPGVASTSVVTGYVVLVSDAVGNIALGAPVAGSTASGPALNLNGQTVTGAATFSGSITHSGTTTFNAALSGSAFGNLTEATSSVLTITGGTGAIVGSGLTIQVKAASGAQAGYLSSADWTTFNNKIGTITITNDTNVTGSVSGGAITLGWTGTLAAGRLNANVVQSVTNDTNVTGSITSQALTIAWSGTLAKARTLSTTVYTDQANTYTAGSKQITTSSASTAGFNLAGVTADPSSLANGDHWYRSDLTQLSYYNGTATKRLATVDQIPSVPVSSVFGRTGAVVAVSGDYSFSLLSGSAVLGQLPSSVAAAITNDTNVTGSISAQNLTLGWTGTLAAGRLNSNVVQAIVNDTNVTGTIATQTLTLGFTGTIAAARLNANVVQSIVNDTNITGSISAQALTLGFTGTLAKARQFSTTVYTDQANTFDAFTQTFNGTVSVATTSTATSGGNFNSPNVLVTGSYWTGSAGAADTWTINNTLGSGTNPTSTLTVTHSGSTGTASVTLPALTVNGNVTSTTTSTATVGGNFSSPTVTMTGSYWTGSVGSADSWTVQDVLGSGTNPTSKLTFLHSGSSGAASVSMPALNTSGNIGAATTARFQLSVGANLDIDGTGGVLTPTVPMIRSSATALVMSGFGSTGGVYLNWDGGGSSVGVVIGNGAAGNVAQITGTGAATFDTLTVKTPASTSWGTSGSNWVTWTPTYTPSASMTFTTPTSVTAKYLRLGSIIYFRLQFTTTVGGTPNQIFSITGLPVSEFTGANYPCSCIVISTWQQPACTVASGTITCVLFSGAFNSGSLVFALSGAYQCAG